MQLIEVPAKTGYIWFRQGIWLFRKNPLALLSVFMTYLITIMLLSRIPILGSVLLLALTPGIAVGFMAACRDTVVGKPVFPNILISGFRVPLAARRLIVLGGLYVVAMTFVFACAALVGGGILLQVMQNAETLQPNAIDTGAFLSAMLITLVIYIPISMLFWFAPVLSAWHDVPPIKAMFFSLVSCWRNRGAFIVYALMWTASIFVLSLVLALLIQLFNADQYRLVLLLIASVILMSMLYCSFYATYRGCFGVQPPSSSAEQNPATNR
jgi:hypothetical protein